MKKVIVTGANGFIGSALCKELSSQGIEVIAVVRSKYACIDTIQNLPGIRIVYCELINFKNLEEVIPDRDADALYHLAWIGSAGFLRGDYQIQMDNVQYTCDTVRACAAMNCKRFVFASSIMEYEIEAFMKEDHTPGINTLYCSSKLAANYMARTIAASLGISYIRAVISNIYGPGERNPRLINTSLRKLLHGEHCAFSAGSQIYDFIYITDAAKAFVAVAGKGIPNRTYYIGSLSPRPLKDFLCEMRDQVNPNIKIGLGELPFTGISLSYKEFDIEAVKNDTGFVPSVDFAQGIRNTIKWIQEQE